MCSACRKILLSNGIEELIRRAKQRHKSCKDAATDALRDLGLDNYNSWAFLPTQDFISVRWRIRFYLNDKHDTAFLLVFSSFIFLFLPVNYDVLSRWFICNWLLLRWARTFIDANYDCNRKQNVYLGLWCR